MYYLLLLISGCYAALYVNPGIVPQSAGEWIEVGDDRLYLTNEDGDLDDLVEGFETQDLDSRYLWGLDRLDSKCGELDRTFEYDVIDEDDERVMVYVVDSGLSRHRDLEDRIAGGVRISREGELSDDYSDENGHGTFVASQVAGERCGSCKDVCEVFGIGVLNGDGLGSVKAVTIGVIYAVRHALENEYDNAIISMSLGGGYSKTMNDAVKYATDRDLTVVVAAGNYNRDACMFSPSSAKSAVTVGSIRHNDMRSGFSNYGKCVDVYAPGSLVLGATLDGGYGAMSGTSMSTPYVSGMIGRVMYSGKDYRDYIGRSPYNDLPVMTTHFHVVNGTLPNRDWMDFSGDMSFNVTLSGRRPLLWLHVGATMTDECNQDRIIEYGTVLNRVRYRLFIDQGDGRELITGRRRNYLRRVLRQPFLLRLLYEDNTMQLYLGDRKVYSITTSEELTKISLSSTRGINFDIV